MNMLPLAFALLFGGFLALAAAMPRHRPQIGIQPRWRASTLRLAGGIALAAGVLACCAAWNPARAVPVALALASVAAICVSLVLTYAPGRSRGLALVILAVGALVVLVTR